MDTAKCSYRNQKLRELALSVNCMGTKEQNKQKNRIQEQQKQQQKAMPFTNKADINGLNEITVKMYILSEKIKITQVKRGKTKRNNITDSQIVDCGKGI